MIFLEKKKQNQCGEGQLRLSSIEARTHLPMADTTQTPFQNPDAISAYYQTRAAHHGVLITSDWLAQAQAAVEQPDSSASDDLAPEKSFNVIDEFNGWRKLPDLAEAVAAIRAMVAVIRASKATTTMELEIELKKASDTLKVKKRLNLYNVFFICLIIRKRKKDKACVFCFSFAVNHVKLLKLTLQHKTSQWKRFDIYCLL